MTLLKKGRKNRTVKSANHNARLVCYVSWQAKHNGDVGEYSELCFAVIKIAPTQRRRLAKNKSLRGARVSN